MVGSMSMSWLDVKWEDTSVLVFSTQVGNFVIFSWELRTFWGGVRGFLCRIPGDSVPCDVALHGMVIALAGGMTTNQRASGGWVTVAEKRRDGRVVRRYRLLQDDKGYYFAGLDVASWRRKTRAAAEARAQRSGFDVFDVYLEAGEQFEPVTYWNEHLQK